MNKKILNKKEKTRVIKQIHKHEHINLLLFCTVIGKNRNILFNHIWLEKKQTRKKWVGRQEEFLHKE